MQQQVQVCHRMVKAPLQDPIEDDRRITAAISLLQRAFHVRFIFAARQDVAFDLLLDLREGASGSIKIPQGKDHLDPRLHAAKRTGVHPGIIRSADPGDLLCQR